jgi:Fe-S cluster assembly protein SufD
MTIQVSTLPEAGDAGVQARADRATYLANLLDLRSGLTGLGLPDGAVASLQAIREAAAARVQELAIPSTREEEWRFTDLSPLLQVSFANINSQAPLVAASDIASLPLPEAADSRLVFVNGSYAPHLSSVSGLSSDVFVGSLADAFQQPALQMRITNYLARQPGGHEVFTSLNTASLTDGAVVWIPRGLVVEQPIQLLFISVGSATPTFNQPRCLVVAEASSRFTLVESYTSLGDGVYFTNPVTEVWLEGNAQVNHTRVQQDSTAAFHIGKTAVSVERNAHYTCQDIQFGASLARHNLEVFQVGEQTEIVLNGLTLLEGTQVGDTHSTIAYSKPYGASRQIHKCIVDDRAHAVFNGKIFVPKAAQLTDAGQLSKNLLLSPKARIDTKPQLEIVADNVKCSHGATVSQLENDEVFYLQSRGIDEANARKLLVYAFAYEVIQEIPVDSLRQQLAALVRSHQC